MNGKKQAKQILRILFSKKKTKNIFPEKKFQRQNDDKTLSSRETSKMLNVKSICQIRDKSL